MNMEKEQTKQLRLEDFKQYPKYVDYYDEDIVVISQWEHCLSAIPSQLNQPVKLDLFLFFICYDGSMQVDVNNQRHILQPNDLITCPPNSVVQHHALLSKGFKGALIALSHNFMRRYLPWKKRTWEAISYLYNNPVTSIREGQTNRFIPYTQLLKRQFELGDHPYRKGIVHSLFAALLYEMASVIELVLNQTATVRIEEQAFKQRDHIFARFMKALEEDNGSHRTVSYYANKLCYTTKYLSKVVKEVSGKTAMEFINQNAIRYIRYQLLYSDKSIKEIADQFEFSNLSFFGKYIKKHLGVSPSQFRKDIDKDNR